MKLALVTISAGALLIVLANGLKVLDAQQPVVRPQAEVRTPAAPKAESHTFRVKDILGMAVRQGEGQAVGTVEDLVVDGRTGQVQYALVAYENTEELFIMPWQILQTNYGPRRADRYVYLQMEPQRLQQAPTITWQQWPQGFYTEWHTWQPQVDTYYKEEMKYKQKGDKEEFKFKSKYKEKQDDD